MAGSGREVLLEVLRTEGVRHLFGNPGTTELPLMDALAGADDLHYVLALQEATAVGMADGYAQATGRPGVPEPAHLGGARQRHRQPHQRPGQRHPARGHRRPAGLPPHRSRPAAGRRPGRAGPRR